MGLSSTEQVLTPISWDRLDEQDLSWLNELCALGYDGTKPMDLVHAAARGEVALLRFRDRGLFVIQAITYFSGKKELLVWGLVGSGIFREAKKIFADLRRYAEMNGCSWISGRSVHPKFAVVYERVLGMAPQATYFVKEV